MSFFVKCIKPFCRSSPFRPSAFPALESEADREVAAIMAARTAGSSPLGRLFFDDDPDPA